MGILSKNREVALVMWIALDCSLLECCIQFRCSHLKKNVEKWEKLRR